MNTPLRFHCPGCGAALPDSLLSDPGAVRNQSSAPPGFDSQRLQIIELGPEIGVPGRGLRMSRVTVAPGALFPAHSHADAPEIIVVLEGRLTEERNGAAAVDYGPGSVLTMTKDVTHTLANRSSVPTVYMSTSVRH
jgi:quercetin dioxygenase-like cupin family protein